MDLGQVQLQEREFVTLCILCAFVDYRGRVFRAKLLQKPPGMLIHLRLSSLTAYFCWPSFPWTAISSRPSSSVLRCRLPLCLLSDHRSLLHFRSHGRSRPQSFVWVSRQSRPRDSLTGAHTPTPNTTNGHIVSQPLLPGSSIRFRSISQIEQLNQLQDLKQFK